MIPFSIVANLLVGISLLLNTQLSSAAPHCKNGKPRWFANSKQSRPYCQTQLGWVSQNCFVQSQTPCKALQVLRPEPHQRKLALEAFERNREENPEEGGANPSVFFCRSLQGEVEIVRDPQKNESSACVFTDGSSTFTWDLWNRYFEREKQ